MNTYKLVADFLESEIDEIIFTYRKKEDVLEFSNYSASMMGFSKEIENPFASKLFLSRFKSESLDSIVSKMNLKSKDKQQIQILFMNKPFILKYQCLLENDELVSVVCLLKEKIEY